MPVARCRVRRTSAWVLLGILAGPAGCSAISGLGDYSKSTIEGDDASGEGVRSSVPDTGTTDEPVPAEGEDANETDPGAGPEPSDDSSELESADGGMADGPSIGPRDTGPGEDARVPDASTEDGPSGAEGDDGGADSAVDSSTPPDTGGGGGPTCVPTACTNICVSYFVQCCKSDQTCGCMLFFPPGSCN
jgi:hypothetical protein